MKSMEKLERYAEYLLQKELAEQTRTIYLKQAEIFLDFLQNRKITKLESIAYKQMLIKQGQKISTMNLYLVALNSYLRYAGFTDCTVKTMKKQNRQCPDNILTLAEYRKLLVWAKESGREKYYCIMRTLALTGIRISELSGCTVEALDHGKFLTCNKGKSREIYLPEKLVAELRAYCEQEKIKEGVIFRGNTGNAISRTAVYKMLTRMAEYVGIPKGKAHPHSFRHLFAITYMQQYSNLFELADLLGHSSLETTRIYTVTTADEKRRKMNKLAL
ncbi:MAG: tyrosine-type recombinase/integrase [Roseburia sp.]|nr:tyrosine-type recombinase/integrase [Ruminococcus sp.]MCM1156400.1 tyrosine-type recombinase/integrase [Roseburia sp.]MCM1242240.1 tyrosine-type recombinase/integrase [Roseburia sp.]